MVEKPKIDEINSLSEMSKIFDQIIILSDCLDRLVETENAVEKVKLNVKSFITDLERCVKDFTNYEMVLTTYLKDEIDLSNMSIKDDLEKEDFEKGESSQNVSLRPQTSRTKTIFENPIMSQERELLRLHGEIMERLYRLIDNKYMIIDKSVIYPRIYLLQGSNPEEIRE